MHILRRDFGLWVASAAVLTALPRIALADPDDDVKPADKGGHHEMHNSGSKHHDGPTTADHLMHSWSFGFRSKAIAQNDWKFEFPEHGQASILIDFKGNWQFTGAFPAQPSLIQPCRTTIGVGLRSSLGKVLAVTKTLTITRNGGSWSKQGHDQIVEDLWKDVVKGHDWKWSAHTRPEVPAEPAPHDGGSGGGDSTFSDVTGDLAKGLLGPIAWFL
jgi:hypothetical protein